MFHLGLLEVPIEALWLKQGRARAFTPTKLAYETWGERRQKTNTLIQLIWTIKRQTDTPREALSFISICVIKGTVSRHGFGFWWLKTGRTCHPTPSRVTVPLIWYLWTSCSLSIGSLKVSGWKPNSAVPKRICICRKLFHSRSFLKRLVLIVNR